MREPDVPTRSRLELIRCSRPCARYYTWRHISGGLAIADLHRSGFGCDAATPMVVCADCARAVLVHLARYHLGSASPARTAQSSSACGRGAEHTLGGGTRRKESDGC